MTEGIPHLVKMHEKYGKDGLVIITVALDEQKDVTKRTANRKKVQEYVESPRRKLPFRSYDLEFDRDNPPENLTFGGTPRVFVFNRDNQYTLRDHAPEKDDLEKAIAEVVKHK